MRRERKATYAPRVFSAELADTIIKGAMGFLDDGYKPERVLRWYTRELGCPVENLAPLIDVAVTRYEDQREARRRAACEALGVTPIRARRKKRAPFNSGAA